MHKPIRLFIYLSCLYRQVKRPSFQFLPRVAVDVAKKPTRSISTSSQSKTYPFSKPILLPSTELGLGDYVLKSPRNHDPDVWLDILDPFLPGWTRRQESHPRDYPAHASHNDLLSFLIRAEQKANLDLLWHLGIVEDRWAAVLYIVKRLARSWGTFRKLSNGNQNLSNVQWLDVDLEMMTQGPIELEQITIRKSTVKHNLDSAIANIDDLRRLESILQQNGFGQVWRSLGNMILTASTSSSEESKRIMPHVLAILAALHHHDLIPESVYKPPSNNTSLLQKPPMLHLLSSKILASLSDAALNTAYSAQSAFVQLNGPNPKARRKVHINSPKMFVDELGHEVWIELVLWSCLHGGWVIDGAAILRNIQKLEGNTAWSLICWKDVLDSFGVNVDSTSPVDWLNWQRSVDQDKSSPNKEARHVVERTISSEVVAAYVDGLINLVHTGVGDRGIPPDVLLDHIHLCKEMLDKHNMGLSFSTWEGILIRFFESKSVNLKTDPEFMLKAFNLIQPYGKELESVNLIRSSSHDNSSIPSYIFDPSAAALGLLHRVIRSYIDLSDIDGALNGVTALRVFTDLNKRRSIEAFFRNLRESNSLPKMNKRNIFSSNIPEKSYPSYFPELPVTVVCGLLELLAETRMFRVSDHLLYSKDIDGPLISPKLYAEPAVAASIIRYGSTATLKRLLKRVLKESRATTKGSRVLPTVVLHALLESQIQRHQWNSVENIFKFIKESQNHDWQPVTVAILAREILLLQQRVNTTGQSDDPDSLSRAILIFRTLLQMGYGKPKKTLDSPHSVYVELHSLLGVLSSINSEWATFCAGLSIKSGSQPLGLDLLWFNYILEGTIAAFDLQAGKRLWDTWCVDLLGQPYATLSTRGVPKLPTIIPSEVKDMINPRNRVVLEDLPTGTWEFRGRLVPRLSTLRIMLRAIMNQEDIHLKEWGMEILKRMAINEERAERELRRWNEEMLEISKTEEV